MDEEPDALLGDVFIERVFAEVDAATAELPDMDAAQIAYATRCVRKALRRTTVAREALEECRDYLNQRADAECDAGGAGYTGNEEMKLLVLVVQALHNLSQDPSSDRLVKDSQQSPCGMAHEEPSMSGMQEVANEESDASLKRAWCRGYAQGRLIARKASHPEHSSDMVERVARIVCGLFVSEEDCLRVAEAVLEVTHHAELAAALETAKTALKDIGNMLELPYRVSVFTSTVLAKIDGDA